MQFFWTNTAIRQYQRFFHDELIRQSFNDLVALLEEPPFDPRRGATLMELMRGTGDKPWSQSVCGELESHGFRGGARVLYAKHVGPSGFPSPAAFSYLIHMEGAPRHTDADHTILLLGVSRPRVARVQ